MVMVVLNPPRLERIDERGKHDSSYNVFHNVVLVESAMPRIVADREELQQRISGLMCLE